MDGRQENTIQYNLQHLQYTFYTNSVNLCEFLVFEPVLIMVTFFFFFLVKTTTGKKITEQ